MKHKENGNKVDEENHVSLHSKEFQNDTLMMVLGLEGEENRKGFRKDGAENYLPAEQHPGWPWLGQQRFLVSKTASKAHFRCVCDSAQFWACLAECTQYILDSK